MGIQLGPAGRDVATHAGAAEAQHGSGRRGAVGLVQEREDVAVGLGLEAGYVDVQQFQVDSLPTTVIIDQDGNVAYVKVGNSSDLEKKLKTAIDAFRS